MVTLTARRIKWLIAPAVLFLFMVVAVPVTHGGVLWSGIDPIFLVNGHQFNVKIEYPSQYDCSINGPIVVDVEVPRGADTHFIAESRGNLGGCIQETRTTISENRSLRNRVSVKAMLRSDESFPVKVKIDFDGKAAKTYHGESNEWISGNELKIDPRSSRNNSNDIDVDVNPEDLQYTYETEDKSKDKKDKKDKKSKDRDRSSDNRFGDDDDDDDDDDRRGSKGKNRDRD